MRGGEFGTSLIQLARGPIDACEDEQAYRQQACRGNGCRRPQSSQPQAQGIARRMNGFTRIRLALRLNRIEHV